MALRLVPPIPTVAHEPGVAHVSKPPLLATLTSPLLCVEASAGTGKTYFIEHRVADLILAGATIEQVLVVTFTEKATAELRGRVRALLERLHAAPEAAPASP